MKYITKAEFRYGGILLSLGALITIICILLEVNAGWASLVVEIKRTDYEAGKFLYDNWDVMSSIWNWSLFGNVFFAISSSLLFKDSRTAGSFPLSLLWVVNFIGSLVLILSFAISIGSYHTTLSVIDSQPYLFESIRGTPLYLFNIGALFQLSVLIIYFQQGFSKQGIVPKVYAIVMILLIVALFLLVFFGVVSFTVFAVACFLVPLLLGIFYYKEGLSK
ncbi:hypothetical protein [Winogradskyella sp. SYSU M77433]|uniref:hypothetical protein n=1 Tax=Winogradskyella sp. SYSU M77433 TaxID=3042722 RepID=UPI002480AE0E|nr:hypothetical protein [Winogradskyella sp. SYSU M77433]MDH7912507.1 hypothetical protein [Winogradskyella sp. SYSU M77433]